MIVSGVAREDLYILFLLLDGVEDPWGSDKPMTVTPLCSTNCPGTVATQLPPFSAARSTTTLPGFKAASIWHLRSDGV
jgi:hypothetical protein